MDNYVSLYMYGGWRWKNYYFFYVFIVSGSWHSDAFKTALIVVIGGWEDVQLAGTVKQGLYWTPAVSHLFNRDPESSYFWKTDFFFILFYWAPASMRSWTICKWFKFSNVFKCCTTRSGDHPWTPLLTSIPLTARRSSTTGVCLFWHAM